MSGEIPPELGSLSSLEWLELNSNQLSGEIPPELGNLSNLIWLELSNNLLTGCIPESLRNSQVNDLPNLGLPFCSVEGPRPTPSLTSASTLATEEATLEDILRRARYGSTPTPAAAVPRTIAATETPRPTPTSTPTPTPETERGFFFNSNPTQIAQETERPFDLLDPVTLSLIGILLTLVATGVQLFKGR